MDRKLVSINRLEKIIKSKSHKKFILCHGCFDLVHIGHLKHFKEAKMQGDKLIVSITSDRYINKGKHRPVFNEKLRAEFLECITLVDYVVINDYPTAINVLKKLRPDVFVKGPDYADRNNRDDSIIKELSICEKLNIKVYFTEGLTSSSTFLLREFISLGKKK